MLGSSYCLEILKMKDLLLTTGQKGVTTLYAWGESGATSHLIPVSFSSEGPLIWKSVIPGS